MPTPSACTSDLAPAAPPRSPSLTSPAPSEVLQESEQMELGIPHDILDLLDVPKEGMFDFDA